MKKVLMLILGISTSVAALACVSPTDIYPLSGAAGTLITLTGRSMTVDPAQDATLNITIRDPLTNQTSVVTITENTNSGRLQFTAPSGFQGPVEIWIDYNRPGLNCGEDAQFTFTYLEETPDGGTRTPTFTSPTTLYGGSANSSANGVEKIIVFDMDQDRDYDIVSFSNANQEFFWLDNNDAGNLSFAKTLLGSSYPNPVDFDLYFQDVVRPSIHFTSTDDIIRYFIRTDNGPSSTLHPWTVAATSPGEITAFMINQSQTTPYIAFVRDNGGDKEVGYDYPYDAATSINFVELNPNNSLTINPLEIVEGDVNADGLIDLVISFVETDGFFTNNVVVNYYINNGNDTFTEYEADSRGGSGSRQLKLIDVNQDGYLDIVHSPANSGLYLQLNNGVGAANNNIFAARTTIDAGPCTGVCPPDLIPNYWDFDEGDIDGDGDIDFIGVESSTMRLILNDGNNSFSRYGNLLTGSENFRGVEIVDLDNDSDLDVVYSQKSTNGIYVIKNIKPESKILSYAIEQDVDGTVQSIVENLNINQDTKKIDVEVSQGTDLTNLSPTIGVSQYASLLNTVTDYSTNVTLRVQSEMLEETEYSVETNAVPNVIEPQLSISQGTISLQWPHVDFADDYLITVLQNGVSYSVYTDYSLSANTTDPFGETIQFNNLTGLQTNTSYEITIKSVSRFGTSTGEYNTTIITPPTPPTNLTVNSQSITENSFTVNWTKSGSLQDIVKLSVGGQVTQENTVATDVSTFSFTSLQPGETYSVSVASINSQNRESSSIQLTVQTFPSSPTLETVATEDIGSQNAVINWISNSKLDNYVLEVSTTDFNQSSNFTAGFPLVLNSSVTTFDIGVDQGSFPLNPSTNYWARIKARNTSGDSDYSEQISFLTLPAAVNESTVQVESVTPSSASVTWTKPSLVSDFEFDLATDQNFTEIISAYNSFDVSAPNEAPVVAIENLAAGTEYFIRIRSVNATGSSDNSSTVSFTTAPPDPANLAVSEIGKTSATLNWDVAASATKYQIELSSTDFVTYVSGYAFKEVTQTTEQVNEALGAGLVYKVRVTALNDFGRSQNPEIVTFITIPGDPTNLGTSNIGLQSARCNWNSVIGAESYTFQLSDEQDFTNLLIDSTLTSTNIDLSTLSQRTTYYFRINAINSSGASDFSSSNFTTDGEDNIAPTGINISRNTVSENLPAESFIGKLTTTDANTFDFFTYALAGSKDDNDQFLIKNDSLFTKTVFNFENKSQYSISIITTDSEEAAYEGSFTVNVLDVNDSPIGISLSNSEITAFDAAGAVGDLGVTDEDGDDTHIFSLLQEYPGFEISGTTLQTTQIFENEEDSSTQLGIRVTDAEGAFTDSLFAITINSFIDEEAPVITNFSSTTNFTASNPSQELGFNVTDFRIKEVTVFFKSFLEEDYNRQVLQSENTAYSFEITADMAEDLGLEIYVFAEDEAGNTSYSSDTLKIVFEYGVSDGPDLQGIVRFGGELNDYQLISIPYEFGGSGDRVQEIFDEINGGIPDELVWRIIQYNNSTNTIQDLVASSRIELGRGYFFNSRENQAVKVSSARVNSQSPFVFELDQNWNLIGNPYDFDIRWDQVIANNNLAEEVGPLRVFDPNNTTGWPESNVLKAGEGAFVQVSQNVNVEVSYQDVNTSGRLDASYKRDRSDFNWYLPLELQQAENYSSAGIGMHEHADESFDKHDRLTIPRWVQFLEIGFEHPEHSFTRFSEDIVPVSNHYKWTFTAASTQKGMATISWDKTLPAEGEFILVDEQNQTIINMRDQSNYSFIIENASFSIHYSKNGENSFLDESIIGTIYPNPVAGNSIKVPVIVTEDLNNSTAQIKIFDLTGKLLLNKSFYSLPQGRSELKLEQLDRLSPGMYHVMTELLKEGKVKTLQRLQKIIIE